MEMQYRRPYKPYAFRKQPGRAYRAGVAAAARRGAYALNRPGFIRNRSGLIRAMASSTFGRRRYTRAGDRGYLLGNDYKFVDLAAASYAASTTGTVTLVATIPQGTTVNSRLGRACQLTSCRVRGSQSNVASGITQTYVAYLVWDRQPNKALAAVTDIFDTVASQSFPNASNRQRFKILKSWQYASTSSNTSPDEDTVSRIDDYVKLPKECMTCYTDADTTGVIGDIVTCALLFVTMGDQALGAPSNPIFNIGFRTNFRE